MAGLIAGFILEPLFSDIINTGYSDRVDTTLQAQAIRWYNFDWMVWILGLASGLILLFTLTSPSTILTNTTSKDPNS